MSSDRRKKQRRKGRTKNCRRCLGTGYVAVSDTPEGLMGGETGIEVRPCECNPQSCLK